jgi:Zn-dependent peptidase ImmA (M78 family)
VEKIKKILHSLEIQLVLLDIEKNGYYDPISKMMIVSSNLPEKEMKKTIIHEIGHDILHRDTRVLYKLTVPRSKMEYEANCFMIKYLLQEYINQFSVTIQQINYLNFLEYYKISFYYRDFVMDLILDLAKNM